LSTCWRCRYSCSGSIVMCVRIYSYSRPFFNEEQKRTNNKVRQKT